LLNRTKEHNKNLSEEV